MTQDKEGRPWPAPGPDVDWWRSGAEADAEPDAPDEPVLAWATPDEVAATWPGVTDADLAGRKAPAGPPAKAPADDVAEDAPDDVAELPADAEPGAVEAETVEPEAIEPGAAPEAAEPAEPEPTETPAAVRQAVEDRGEPDTTPPRRTTSPYDTPPRTGATHPPARPLPPPAVALPPTTPVPVPAGALRQATVATVPDATLPAMPRTTRPTVPLQRTPPVRPGRRSWQSRYRAGLRRRPWVGIPALLVLTMLAAFLAWVSAEPFWLAFGRGQAGSAVVVQASGGCRADVRVGETTFASNVDLAGVGAGECRVGATVPVQMLRADADRAYAADAAGLHLRWAVGLFLVLLCGLLIAWLTGATSFAGWRFAAAIALSVGGPAAIATALLFAAQT